MYGLKILTVTGTIETKLLTQIVEYMEHYDDFLVALEKQVTKLNKEYFSRKQLYEAIEMAKDDETFTITLGDEPTATGDVVGPV